MYTQLNQYHVILEAQPRSSRIREAEQHLRADRRFHGASGPGASSSFASSASVSAGSNATTTCVLYTPSSGTLTPPANVLTRSQLNSRVHRKSLCTALSNAVPLSAFSTFRDHGRRRCPSIIRDNFLPSPFRSTLLQMPLGERDYSDRQEGSRDLHFPPSLQSAFKEQLHRLKVRFRMKLF